MRRNCRICRVFLFKKSYRRNRK